MILFFLHQLHFLKIHEIEAHHQWWNKGFRPLYCPYYPENISLLQPNTFSNYQESVDRLRTEK